jgi:TPP-dependent pyruvate/acetoin dehydrogenase alpha subunit
MHPLAVIDAYKRKRKIIEEKRGPVLLDVLTYRYSGHSPSDASSYRSKEEVEKTALANEQTLKQLGGNSPKKVIVVPGKIVNIVI